jgi:hypothetical protein
MAKRKQSDMAPLQRWAQGYSREDIPSLAKRTMVIYMGDRYDGKINDVVVARGQSPCDTRRRVVSALERLIQGKAGSITELDVSLISQLKGAIIRGVVTLILVVKPDEISYSRRSKRSSF